ncbi:MAG TPA: ATP-binding protein [Candidatus Gastranaerophilales bacterium]|nr:ATP-binding protein [Candidatus Gastranaerophilales bacterium]
MKIAIASGKGGTGKSTVATNFAYLLSKIYKDVCLLDCDVEEPNCHIFLKPYFNEIEKIYVETPVIDVEKCVKCGKCAEVCQFNALAFVKEKVLVFQELCHGCGSCVLTCPVNAIGEKGREVGVIEKGVGCGFDFIHGKLRIGEAMSPPLIKAVKKAGQEHNLQILDCPPGTSCPAIAAVYGADYVFMVTEPTPFGLYDLNLGVEVLRKIGLPFGIIINRSGENDKLIEDYAKTQKINILTKIADDRKIAECYSGGELVLRALPEYKEAFQPLLNIVREGI